MSGSILLIEREWCENSRRFFAEVPSRGRGPCYVYGSTAGEALQLLWEDVQKFSYPITAHEWNSLTIQYYTQKPEGYLDYKKQEEPK